MMKKVTYIKCVVAAMLSFAATSCTKESSTPEEKFVDNFNALVMGGKTIDSHQDWNTVGSVAVTVSVDFGNTDEYTVYILQTPPLFDTNALWLGMAKVKGGESKTITIAKPANAGLLYAACYDSMGHAVCKPFPVKADDTVVAFSGKSQEAPSVFNSEDNPWNVETQELPDLTEYTTGTLVEATDQDTGISDEPLHFKVSSDYTGFIPSLGTYLNKSVYVTATWTLSFNQRVSAGNVIVVGEGGTINIPKEYTLTTSPFSSEGAGLIYVLPGGTITGDGTVEFTTNEGTYSYNGGTITAKNIQLKGCTLYNAGTVGDMSNPTSELNCIADASGVGQLINVGTAALAKMTGEELSIENAGILRVTGELVLNNSSKMDDGSYTECTALTLNGSSNGDKVLYMGNAAFLNCLGDISIDNFGVWGPSGDDYEANAVLKVKNCTNCATTDGTPGTYLLDHVELIVPANFPTIFDKGAMNIYDGDVKGIGIGKLLESFSGYHNLRMLYYWLNGYEGKILDSSNYEWSLATGKYNYLWKSSVNPGANDVDPSAQTCFYSTSPSFDYPSSDNFKKEVSGNTPENSYVFYAFETLDANTKDFDYDDVILRVDMPVDNGDGTFTSNVLITCVGNKTKTTMLYNGEAFGEEIHAAMGIDVNTTVNTTNVSRSFRKMGELTFSSPNIHIDKLNFSIKAETAEGNVLEENQPSTLGTAPLYLVINGDTKGKWFWPTEGMNIGVAYPQFSVWASNLQTSVDWYDSSNASRGIVNY